MSPKGVLYRFVKDFWEPLGPNADGLNEERQYKYGTVAEISEELAAEADRQGAGERITKRRMPAMPVPRSNVTYKRGQVVWANWQLFLVRTDKGPMFGSGDIPSEFAGRVKKLWEFGVPIPPEERPGTGTAIEYSAYHAFELAVALKLWDLGLKQSEVAEMIIPRREALQRFFANPFFPAFLPVRLAEVTEGWGSFGPFLRASVVNDSEVLSLELMTTWIERLEAEGTIVLEVGGIFGRIIEYLDKAPEIRRGRP